jgi:hypothetical protein
VAGVTGTRTKVASRVEGLLVDLRTATDKPIAVGFGISTGEHAAQVRKPFHSFLFSFIHSSFALKDVWTATDNPVGVAFRISTQKHAAQVRKPLFRSSPFTSSYSFLCVERCSEGCRQALRLGLASPHRACSTGAYHPSNSLIHPTLYFCRRLSLVHKLSLFEGPSFWSSDRRHGGACSPSGF